MKGVFIFTNLENGGLPGFFSVQCLTHVEPLVFHLLDPQFPDFEFGEVGGLGG